MSQSVGGLCDPEHAGGTVLEPGTRCSPAPQELRELQANLEGEDLPEGVPLDREIFMHLIGADETGRVKQGSAADATGWRWEHLAWIVTAGGADELYELCNKLWLGTIEMVWVHAGRIVALRKPTLRGRCVLRC